MKRRDCEGWSVAGDRELKRRDRNWSVAIGTEASPAIESWSVTIGTEASRLELKHRWSEQKGRRRLNRCDWKWAEASSVSEASRLRAEASPESEVKRRQRLRWSVAIYGNGVTTASRSMIYGNGVMTACWVLGEDGLGFFWDLQMYNLEKAMVWFMEKW